MVNSGVANNYKTLLSSCLFCQAEEVSRLKHWEGREAGRRTFKQADGMYTYNILRLQERHKATEQETLALCQDVTYKRGVRVNATAATNGCGGEMNGAERTQAATLL